MTLKPDATIGILGGGQLGRMLALAAARLGFKCHVFSPDPDSPAFDVVQHATCADYADVEALELFAADVDVITYEFENVPAADRDVPRRAQAGAARPAGAGDHAGPAGRKEFRQEARHRHRAYRRVSIGRRRCAPRSRGSAGRRCSRRAASATTARARP